jgi:hypothetical protein
MGRVGEEILIRTVSTVIALVIVFIIVELAFKKWMHDDMSGGCGCGGKNKAPSGAPGMPQNPSSPTAGMPLDLSGLFGNLSPAS